MTDKTIPAPLCLMTMNDFLRPFCEDEKSGGIESAMKMNSELGLENQPPPEPHPRDNLNPHKYGVRFDPNKAHCVFTREYCSQAGLASVTNQLGQLDCQLPEGQGVAELIFGTTLVRAMVASVDNSGQTLDALLNPARYHKKKPGESCRALSECIGVQDRTEGNFVTCCPATKEIGQEVMDLTAAGSALIATSVGMAVLTPLTFGASTPVAAASAVAATALFDKAQQLPRTCQVMDWSRTSAVKTPFCPFEAGNPANGVPIKDGELCGLAGSCERCVSKTQSFWKSKGFTACGVEPKWEDGKRCGPGVTCTMCKNGSAVWDDGAHRCGPRVAGTTVSLGGTCAYNNHCISNTDPNEGSRTMCCDEKCVRAVLDNSAWYCPGGVLGKTKNGGKCTIGGTCEGFTSATSRSGCCNGTCQQQTLVEGLWRCPSELVKDRDDGVTCVAAQCLRCKRPHTYWYSKNHLACGPEPKWPDGKQCAAGTSCNSCANRSSVWSDALVRCGTQGKTWSDGVLCGPGATCERYCKNTATQWRNGSWYCGTQPAKRCCSNTITFEGKCVMKESVIKPLWGCTAGLIDPGDGKCHGIAQPMC